MWCLTDYCKQTKNSSSDALDSEDEQFTNTENNMESVQYVLDGGSLSTPSSAIEIYGHTYKSIAQFDVRSVVSKDNEAYDLTSHMHGIGTTTLFNTLLSDPYLQESAKRFLELNQSLEGM